VDWFWKMSLLTITNALFLQLCRLTLVFQEFVTRHFRSALDETFHADAHVHLLLYFLFEHTSLFVSPEAIPQFFTLNTFYEPAQGHTLKNGGPPECESSGLNDTNTDSNAHNSVSLSF
jgi:hypothetical protein